MTIIAIIGGILFIALPATLAGWLLFMAALEYRRDRVPILLYHRLISKAAAERGDVPDDEMIYVSYDTAFADQMNHLRDAGYTTLDFDDYLRIREGRMPMPAKPVIVTFDDGYLSNYTMAFPALKANRQKAIIYVAPEPDEHTRHLVRGVDGFLNPDQMRELAANGVAIQSHTLTHCVLNELDDDRIRFELTESRDRLAEYTGRSVDHLAIPRAGYSRRVYRIARACGYKTVCCNKKGTANGLSDLLALPRIVIERDMTLQAFARCLSPRAALQLRVVGNLKRIPEFLGGAKFASRLRRALYASPLRPLFETSNLKRAVAVVAMLYLAASIWFTIHLITR